MKSAYELAMERLAAAQPAVRLNDDQKRRIAEIEAKCRADIAAKELLLGGEMEKARADGEADPEGVARWEAIDEPVAVDEDD